MRTEHAPAQAIWQSASQRRPHADHAVRTRGATELGLKCDLWVVGSSPGVSRGVTLAAS